MRTPLILLFIELMLNWTNIHTGCLGLPIQDRGRDVGKSSRFRRSLHALHSQLCPEGSSSESCFYSQLSMFMRMQDSLMDPVALRNIGKRSSLNGQYNGQDSHETANNILDLELEAVPNHKMEKGLPLSYLQLMGNFVNMLNKLKAIFNSRGTYLGENGINSSKSAYYFFDPADLDEEGIDAQRQNVFNTPKESSPSIDNVMEQISGENNKKLFGSYVGFENNQRNTEQEVLESQMNRNNLQGPSVKKRQIICPPGVSRLNCYDNALAFYMRLLKTLKSH